MEQEHLDFARASIARMICLQLSGEVSDFSPLADNPGLRKPDAIRQMTFPASDKRDLLGELRRLQGIKGVLLVGQQMRYVLFDAIWNAALNARNPRGLFDGMRRLERYTHATNRVRVEQPEEESAHFIRYISGRSGQVPSDNENFLVCGLTIALLQQIGCRAIKCEMEIADAGWHPLFEEGRFQIPEVAPGFITTEWRIAWSGQVPREKSQSGFRVGEPDVTQNCSFEDWATVKGVLKTLAEDVSHPWRLEEMANELVVSGRSLQRRLARAGQSLSQLIRSVRIQYAQWLIRERLDRGEPAGLTEIGFCSGFSDSAQFSRDFRNTTGMSPSEFRRSLCNL